MKKVIKKIENEYTSTKQIHFFVDNSMTICGEYYDGGLDEYGRTFKILEDDSKRKVDCYSCFSLVEMCKSVKRSQYVSLSKFTEEADDDF